MLPDGLQRALVRYVISAGLFLGAALGLLIAMSVPALLHGLWNPEPTQTPADALAARTFAFKFSAWLYGVPLACGSLICALISLFPSRPGLMPYLFLCLIGGALGFAVGERATASDVLYSSWETMEYGLMNYPAPIAIIIALVMGGIAFSLCAPFVWLVLRRMVWTNAPHHGPATPVADLKGDPY